MELLGHVADREGVLTDPKTVDEIKMTPRTSFQTELHSFFGFERYYGHFTQLFATIYALLHAP